MFIRDNKKEFYEYLLRQRSRLLIIVSNDLDSICSTKILQNLLECDQIQYTIITINSKEELFRLYKEHSDGIKTLLLINIGITFDVRDFLDPEECVRIFIADSHRPIDVYNAYHDLEDVSIMTAITHVNQIDNETHSIPKYEDMFWDSDEEDNQDVRGLSLKKLERRDDKKVWEQKRRRIESQYLQFGYYSFSTSLLFFDLSWKLSKDNNELLWLSIIAVSDQFINDMISEEKYVKQCNYIRDAMTRLKNIRGERGIALNSIATNGEENANIVTNNNHLNISYEKDLKLTLYRNWSIYESLRHTMYVCCKLKIWKLRGHKRLLAFLAQLGLPLTQCKQKFSSMDLDFRNNVKQWIEDLSLTFDLKDIIGHSFIANRGFKHKYNSNDVAIAAKALLESADKDKRQNQKFFDAMDCLSWNNIDLLEKGLDLAKLQLSAILKQVQIIVDSRQISLMNGSIWYVIIPESTPDANLFCYAGCLNTLGRFILRANAATNPKNMRNFRLPLVIVTPNPNRPGMAVVCGIPPILSSDGLNNFHRAFKQMSGSSIDYYIEPDLVDPSVAHLPYSERINFINLLSNLFER